MHQRADDKAKLAAIKEEVFGEDSRDAEIKRLRAAVLKAEGVFGWYATLHREKRTLAGHENAEANERLAREMRAALENRDDK